MTYKRGSHEHTSVQSERECAEYHLSWNSFETLQRDRETEAWIAAREERRNREASIDPSKGERSE